MLIIRGKRLSALLFIKGILIELIFSVSAGSHGKLCKNFYQYHDCTKPGLVNFPLSFSISLIPASSIITP